MLLDVDNDKKCNFLRQRLCKNLQWNNVLTKSVSGVHKNATFFFYFSFLFYIYECIKLEPVGDLSSRSSCINGLVNSERSKLRKMERSKKMTNKKVQTIHMGFIGSSLIYKESQKFNLKLMSGSMFIINLEFFSITKKK